MEKKPYHHLSDGSFRNPRGSPERDSNFKWSFKIFNKEKKKLNLPSSLVNLIVSICLKTNFNLFIEER